MTVKQQLMFVVNQYQKGKTMIEGNINGDGKVEVEV